MASFPTDNDKCPSSSLHRRRRLVLKPLWRPDHPTSHQYGPTGVDSLTPVHNHNLFVRLSPQTAQRLWYVATSKTKNGDAATNSIVTTTCQFEPNPQQLQNGSRSTTRNGGASSSLWTWMTDSLTAAAAAALPPPPGEIEFLPLKIITSNHGTVYASYNGGGIANQPNDGSYFCCCCY